MSAPQNGTAAAGGGNGGAGQAQAAPGEGSAINPELENELLSHYLFAVLGCLAAVLIIWRCLNVLVRYVRQVTCLNNDTQRYFAAPSAKVSFFKKTMQYAPILTKRHNREFALSSAVNMGTLPTRLQLVVLTGYFATNVAFCVLNISFHENFDSVADQLRNRTGVLAVVNMVPLFLMAGRNNPLINWLGISFDTFNLLHRWLGRIVILETLAHVLAHWIGSSAEKGFSATFATTLRVPYMMWGFVVSRHRPPCRELLLTRYRPLAPSLLLAFKP